MSKSIKIFCEKCSLCEFHTLREVRPITSKLVCLIARCQSCGALNSKITKKRDKGGSE